MSRPIAVAITGGIGAGKSEALAAFARHGAATVSADEIVHHLLATDDEVKAALVERFGERILGDDGRPDRARIGEIVFADQDALAWLERLLHPIVSRTYMVWRDALAVLDEPPAVCVTEVPLLFEVGSEQRFDKVVVVTAPQPLRAERRRVPHDDRDERLLPDAEKVARADYAYVNDGSLDDLDAFVAGVMHDLVQ
ncbi:MAG TPA: dephospho-CoA kinase [Gaiellaceae bacterium]|nr:dephospho-CoA kinase [Gaiellaceae bacterium]